MEKFLERMENIKIILKVILIVEVLVGGVCVGLDILIKPINTRVLTNFLSAIKQITTTGSSLSATQVLVIVLLILILKK